VNLFLDASVVLAACGRPAGASRAVFDLASHNSWMLMTSPYVVSESREIFPACQRKQRLIGRSCARGSWRSVTCGRWIGQPFFGPAKDRPVLFTAAAWAEVLLTLDRGDFGVVMERVSMGGMCWCPGIFSNGNAPPGG
jgi:hypothetical protein